ncbi:MAG: right-handed parallel beta-helix repeat-containing protein [bacterium]
MFRRLVLGFSFIFFLPAASIAATYTATTINEIRSYTNMLTAGDTLLIQSGTYNFTSCWSISNKKGTDSAWITIAPTGGIVKITGSFADNMINIYNSGFLHIKGLEITNTSSVSGIDGIKIQSTSDHITLEDLHLHDLTGNGISCNLNGVELSYLVVRHCHIHHIRDYEGIYLGKHEGGTPIHDSMVEFNWIHDCTSADRGRGIQFKRGTYRNIIQDNVVYNCRGGGIVLYKTDRALASDNNIVWRNVIWNSPGEGIFAVGQTNIENNIVFNCNYGINTGGGYTGWGMNDLYIRNNTVYYATTTCLRLDARSNKSPLVCINNACYQNSLSATAIHTPYGIGSWTLFNNRHYGACSVSGSTPGNPPVDEFINPCLTSGIVNLYPKINASLRDTGTANYNAPIDDFNCSSRPFGEFWDVGAYEWSQNTNPGWQLQEGFKEYSVKPSITLKKTCDRQNVRSGGTITYTITYKNEGQSTAMDVVIIDVLPKNTVLESGVWSQESGVSYWYDNQWNVAFNQKASKIRWIIPKVAPSESGTVSFCVEVR